MNLGLGLGLPFAYAQPWSGAAYDPRIVFGSDLVTWYGNSIDALWAAQSAGGAVTLYQDAAGATPVTAIGQTVGRINDLSGNGYHLTQSASTSRMVLQHDGTSAYLLSDGSNDSYLTQSIDLSSTDSASVVSCVRVNTSHTGMVCEFSGPNGDGDGAFHLACVGGGGLQATLKGSLSAGSAYASSGYAAPVSLVLSGEFDISTDTLRCRANGAVAASIASDRGSGNLGNYPLAVSFRRGGTLLFNGRIYGLPMIVKRLMTAGELAAAEKAFGKSIGVLQ